MTERMDFPRLLLVPGRTMHVFLPRGRRRRRLESSSDSHFEPVLIRECLLLGRRDRKRLPLHRLQLCRYRSQQSTHLIEKQRKSQCL